MDTPKDSKTETRDNSIFGAMRVNPREYKASWNDTFWDRTKFAIAGLLFMLRRERSVHKILFSATVTFLAALWLQLDTLHIVILVLAFAILWAVETLNSAIEAVVDMVTQEYHPMAKVAKDVAASATFILSITCGLISITLVVIPLLERIGIL